METPNVRGHHQVKGAEIPPLQQAQVSREVARKAVAVTLSAQGIEAASRTLMAAQHESLLLSGGKPPQAAAPSTSSEVKASAPPLASAAPSAPVTAAAPGRVGDSDETTTDTLQDFFNFLTGGTPAIGKGLSGGELLQKVTDMLSKISHMQGSDREKAISFINELFPIDPSKNPTLDKAPAGVVSFMKALVLSLPSSVNQGDPPQWARQLAGILPGGSCGFLDWINQVNGPATQVVKDVTSEFGSFTDDDASVARRAGLADAAWQNFQLAISGDSGSMMDAMMQLFRIEMGDSPGLFKQSTLFALIDQASNSAFPAIRPSVLSNLVDNTNSWLSSLQSLIPKLPTTPGDANSLSAPWAGGPGDDNPMSAAKAIALLDCALRSYPSSGSAGAQGNTITVNGQTIKIPPISAFFPANSNASADTRAALSQIDALRSSLEGAVVIPDSNHPEKTVTLGSLIDNAVNHGFDHDSIYDISSAIHNTLTSYKDTAADPKSNPSSVKDYSITASNFISQFSQVTSAAGNLSSSLTRSITVGSSTIQTNTQQRFSLITSMMQLLSSLASQLARLGPSNG
jgi:hypothetical protein